MSYYEDFKAKAIQTPEQMGELIAANGGELKIYIAHGLGARSFVHTIIVGSDFLDLSPKTIFGDPSTYTRGEWFEGESLCSDSTVHREYNSFADAGITDRPHNKHLTFVDKELAEAYIAAVENDPVEVERIKEEDAYMDEMERYYIEHDSYYDEDTD